MTKALSNFKSQFKIKNFINYAVILVLLAVFVIINATSGLGRGTLSTITRITYSMILAVSLNMVVGFLGELSLGHAGFMCVGAYVGCFFSNMLEGVIGNGVLSIIICMLIGGLVAAVFGLVIGIPALRLRGDYLAITTLAFGEIVRNLFKNMPWFGGAKGLTTSNYDYKSLFIVAIIVLFVVLALCQNLIRSKHGRAITAIRDNEIAAKAMGINVTFYKLFVFIMAAFFAGVAGVLYGKCIGKIEQQTFDYNYSIEILVMVVLGGMGSINGSMIAAAAITYINILLQNQLSGSLAPLKLVVYAAILIIFMIYLNAPAFSKVRSVLSINSLKAKLRKKKALTDKEDEADWTRIQTNIHIDETLRVDAKKREGEMTDPDKEMGGK